MIFGAPNAKYSLILMKFTQDMPEWCGNTLSKNLWENWLLGVVLAYPVPRKYQNLKRLKMPFFHGTGCQPTEDFVVQTLLSNFQPVN